MSSGKKFDSAIEMFHKLGLDTKHWVNKEQMQYFKRNVYERIEQKVSCYPKELDDIFLTCDCGYNFVPRWVEKRPPIMPFFAGDGKLLQPISGETPCLECGANIKIKLQTSIYKGDVLIYGDEAIRDIGDKLIYSYSVVSKPREQKIHQEFTSEFMELKKSLVPNLNPNTWCLHYKELLNGKARVRSGHLKHLSTREVLEFSKRLGHLLKRYENDIIKWNCTGVYYKPDKFKRQEDEYIKSLVYYPLLIRVISEVSTSGFSPHFYFERTGSDGWAKNLFQGGRLTLMWPFISHCIPVPAPKFSPPTESIYLEMADFVSFCIARYLYIISKKESGIELDFDMLLEWLGEIRYSGYTADGTCVYDVDREYPLEKFFKGTNWEKYGKTN